MTSTPRPCLGHRPRARVGAQGRGAPAFVAALLCLAVVGASPPALAAGQWRDLNGRVAPDLTFADAALGLAPGTTLASLRGRQVVLLAFWLRDCPHCKREMPRVQELYDQYGRSGLQVVTVVHGYSTAEVAGVMRERGWDFPVASDPDGQMATLYGGGRRPGFFVVGLDGRVRSSGGISMEALGEELARFRLAELGEVPAALEAVRQRVWRGDYGGGLKLAEEAAAAKDAPAPVGALARRLAEVAAQRIENRRWRAERAVARGQGAVALEEMAGLAEAFAGTSLAEKAARVAAEVRALVERR